MKLGSAQIDALARVVSYLSGEQDAYQALEISDRGGHIYRQIKILSDALAAWGSGPYLYDIGDIVQIDGGDTDHVVRGRSRLGGLAYYTVKGPIYAGEVDESALTLQVPVGDPEVDSRTRACMDLEDYHDDPANKPGWED